MTDEQKTAAQKADETAGETLACLREALQHLPSSIHRIVDVGCASGSLPAWLATQGYSAVGFDLNVKPRMEQRLSLIQWDLRRSIPARLRIQGELVLCWEVAEHIPDKSADTLCASLARVTVAGGTLLFSAATPGQGGDGHVNEQPVTYWVEKLERVGFELQTDLSFDLRTAFHRVAPNNWWYAKNILAFTKRR